MANVLGVPPKQINEDTSMDTTPGWDSVRHLNLILAFEEALDIRFSPEETVGMTSYPEIIRVLSKHVQDLA